MHIKTPLLTYYYASGVAPYRQTVVSISIVETATLNWNPFRNSLPWQSCPFPMRTALFWFFPSQIGFALFQTVLSFSTNTCKCQNSFEEVSRLREAICEDFSELPIIIIGNKIDLIGILNFPPSVIKTFTEENFVITTMNFRIFQIRVQTPSSFG